MNLISSIFLLKSMSLMGTFYRERDNVTDYLNSAYAVKLMNLIFIVVRGRSRVGGLIISRVLLLSM